MEDSITTEKIVGVLRLPERGDRNELTYRWSYAVTAVTDQGLAWSPAAFSYTLGARNHISMT
jgi:hypothetical protein